MNGQIYLVVVLFITACVYCYGTWPILNQRIRERWELLRNRRDRRSFRPRPAPPFEREVRQLLDDASQRSLKLPRPNGSDSYIALLMGTPHDPRIWARVTITLKSIVIAIEYPMRLDKEERSCVNTIVALFTREYAEPAATRSAPVPKDFEFQAHR